MLDFWWTLESLNFSEVPKIGKKNVHAIRCEEDWPWRTGLFRPHREGKTDYTWTHHIYLGVTKSLPILKGVFTQFAERLPDVGAKLPRGSTAIAALIVDDAGRLVTSAANPHPEETPSVKTAAGDADTTSQPAGAPAPSATPAPRLSADRIAFSTLPWALARLSALASGKAWEGMQFEALCENALEDISQRFARTTDPLDQSGCVVNLSRAQDVLDAWREATGWTGCWDEVARVHSIRVRMRGGKPENVDPPLLNSFFLADLERVMEGVQANAIGPTLCRYLRSPELSDREKSRQKDMLQHPVHAEHWLHPKRWAEGAWPHKGGHSLVYGQQCAINAIWGELSDANTAGLMAVNGPPGTGKTTMLGDLVAAVITQRAELIARLPSATDAFGERTKLTDMAAVCPLRPEFLGHEIVVASSNNVAVENITRELPNLAKVDATWFAAGPEDGRHFADLARVMLNPPPRKPTGDEPETDPEEQDSAATEAEPIEAWGLVTAVLGKTKNRYAFSQFLWMRTNPESGFRPYVDRLVAGTPDAEKNFADAQRRFKELAAEVRALQRRAERCSDAVEQEEAKSDEYAAIDTAGQEVEKERIGREAALARASTHLSRARSREDAFGRAFEAADALLKWLQQSDAADGAQQRLDDAAREVEAVATKQAKTSETLSVLRNHADRQHNLRTMHGQRKPAFWTFWFARPVAKEWSAEARSLDRVLRDAYQQLGDAERMAAEVTDELRRQHAAHEQCVSEHRTACSDAAALKAKAEIALGRTAEDDSLRKAFRDLVVLRKVIGTEHVERHAELAAAHQSVAASEEALDQEQAAMDETLVRLTELKAEQARVLADLERAASTRKATQAGRVVIDTEFRQSFADERAQASPWIDEQWRQARIRLFLQALKLHRAFIIAAWEPLKANLGVATDLLRGQLPPGGERHLPSLWASLCFVTPVVSTTFASLDRLFRGMNAQSLGWLVIDEAGQATPQAAVGGLWRARRAVIVGDPYQIEPVVTLPERLINLLREKWQVTPHYVPGPVSAQRLADQAMEWGAHCGVDNLWVGCPLLVHRRCIDPMFTVANEISYANQMVQGRRENPDFVPLFGPSAWIDIAAPVTHENWVAEEGRLAIDMARHAWALGEQGSVYFITPFRSVADQLATELNSTLSVGATKKEREKVAAWVDAAVGTVHTFQGKENSQVVFVLGGDSTKTGLLGWAAGKPNLINVALTRAKERIYVVGNKTFWCQAEHFSTLVDALLPPDFGGVVSPAAFRKRWRSSTPNFTMARGAAGARSRLR